MERTNENHISSEVKDLPVEKCLNFAKCQELEKSQCQITKKENNLKI